MTVKVGVIGAGICGRSVALMLRHIAAVSHTRMRISLFDGQGVGPHALMNCPSAVAAGMLAPYSEASVSHKWLIEAGSRALALWPSWVEQLDRPSLLSQSGTAVVAHPQDKRELHDFSDRLMQVEEGDMSCLAPLPQSLTSQFAGRFNDALFLHEEAHVNVPDLLTIMADRISDAANIDSHCMAVQSIDQELAVVTLGNGERITFDYLIDCRGLGAKSDHPDLRGVRGEVLTVHAPEVNYEHMIRLMHPRYCLYLVPRPDNVYVLGATMLESEDKGPVTVRSALELLSALYSIDKGFSEACVLSMRAECRPAFPDNQPRIATFGRTITINGLYRHGILLSPLAAQVASRTLLHAIDERAVWHKESRIPL
ncbi:FAD-dependent oxidoreductase [Aestuariibacter sp. AA17]|uniref:D-amino-acid oxidase n=1 Tax=Fluctibacter corallii TaxID=2984329 RepID=A0ABT3AC04_9ALTE|nr:FAD-dependent oxidoreductase [Aestuariibacter sp. AA17]MCV2886223.1 FAD-dependent oxidoreductase [Aestuariibacter sp. AA17]